MKTIYIIAGPPGSGKSTTAEIIAEGYYPKARVEHYEAEMYFIKDGEYKFDAALIKDAHAWCQNQVLGAMTSYCPIIIVSNTFTKQWERQPYIDMAKKYNYAVVYIHCNGRFNNIHDVPQSAVDRMIENYEPYKP